MYGKNCLVNTDEFYGIVVMRFSRDVGLINQPYTMLSPTPTENFTKSDDVNVYKVYIPELECRPFPIAFNDPILATYQDVHGVPGVAGSAPGDIVRVQYRDLGNMKNPRIVGKVGEVDSDFLPAQMAEGLGIQFDSGTPGLNSAKSGETWAELLDGVPNAAAGQVIESAAPPRAVNIRIAVTTELDLWSGKKETDTEVTPRLKAYWSNLGLYESWSSNIAVDVPWSAAFISYVMNQVDPEFPKSSGHYYYAASAKQKKGGWSLFQTSGAGKIKAQVGDVFVKPRTCSDCKPTAAHGDVVYKITESTASLAGGNVGGTGKPGTQTARGDITLSVDTSGYYKNFGNYAVVLKKAGRIVSIGAT